jgi:serine/threonine-protein kinase
MNHKKKSIFLPLVQIDLKENTRGWSVHNGNLEQVYYIFAEEINIPEPNFNPTPKQILKIINELSQ